MGARWLAAALAVLALASAAAQHHTAQGQLAARRRSATDRGFIRFGRSSLPETSASEFQHAPRESRSKSNLMLRFGRAGPNFLRFGRPNLQLSNQDLYDLLQSYTYDQKRSDANILRFGRSGTNFLRLGRNVEDTPQNRADIDGVLTLDQRNALTNDNFRLGRSPDELDGESEDRETSSAKECASCEQ